MVHREDSYGTDIFTLPEEAKEGQYLVTIETMAHEKIPYTGPSSVGGPASGSMGGSVGGVGNLNDPATGGGVRTGRGSKKDSEGDKEIEEESKCEGLNLQEEKEGEREEGNETEKDRENETGTAITAAVPVAANSSNSSNSSGNSLANTSTNKPTPPPVRPVTYGITEQEGSVWVEWLVSSSRGGSVSVGCLTAAAAEDPDAR